MRFFLRPWHPSALLAVGAATALFPVAAGESPGQVWDFEKPLMGTLFRIRLQEPDATKAEAAADAAFAAAFAVEKAVSGYRADSDLSVFLQKPGQWQQTSGHLREVWGKAFAMAEASGGAFDPTVGPLVTLWKRAARRQEWPEPWRLAEARGHVGYRKIGWEPATGRLLVPEGMYPDLGGIAKGYAADVMRSTLAEKGVRRTVCAASGDIAVGDPPEGREGWDVALWPLGSEAKDKEEHHLMANAAVSTSGDAYQFWEWEGRKLSHIVDPLTGEPVAGSRAVTVFATRAVDTDSLATALSVLGPERAGALLARYPGARAVFFLPGADGTMRREEVAAGKP